jgi:signal transduction histidine kinase
MRDTVDPQILETSAPGFAQSPRPIRFGLGARILIIFAALVMVADIAIYVPLIVSYHDNWLRNRLSAGYTAALALEAAPSSMVSPSLQQQLLDSVGVQIIVLKAHGTRRILAASVLPPAVDEIYDMENATLPKRLAATFRSLTGFSGRVLTVVGAAPIAGGGVEITMNEAPLKAAMWTASDRILFISVVTSLLVAAVTVAIIHRTMLGPVRRLTTSITNFAENPEDASRVIAPVRANHEIGYAEMALAEMQTTLARELHQKKRLAALGLAVAKINHDMRNMLSSAQLLSDRLAGLSDPLARRIAPKLVATLDRAIRFCQATLAYGQAVDEAPKVRQVTLRDLVTEAAETAAHTGQGRVAIRNAVPEGFTVDADPEQLFRVLMNLIRNGVEAVARAGAEPGRPEEVVVTAQHRDGSAVIEVADTGPGIPPHLQANLFRAFQSSARPGGSGLGLSIAADLVRAHGGRLTLVSDKHEIGTRFEIALPNRAGGSSRESMSRKS